MSDLVPDHSERELALDTTRSFICEAPAGSGKTELLTQRFLNLLAQVENPEDILAITFTRKATGEMRERVVSALHLAEGEKPDSAHRQTTWRLGRAVLERDQQLGWHLRKNPSRLRIQTFDSLCSSLTQQLPLESSLGAQPQIVEDATELYRLAVRNLLISFEQDNPWADELGHLIALLDNQFERFETLMIDMLRRREEWLPLILGQSPNIDSIKTILEENFRSVIRDRIEAVREKIPAQLQRDLIEFLGFAAANLHRIHYRTPISACLDIDLNFRQLPPNAPKYVPLWLGLASLLTTVKGDWRKSIDKRSGFPKGEGSEEELKFKLRKKQLLELIETLSTKVGLNEDLSNLRNLPQPSFDADQWRILQALFTVLPILVAQLKVVFKENNSVDFSELSIGAKRALGSSDEPTQLIQKLDYRLRHILVDEFQDTSQSQVDLLNQLTSGWTPGDGRTVFCVGDAMQSIYGFRGANVGLFLHSREHGLHNVPLQPLSLRTNFRSQAGLVEWNNKIFSAAFPKIDNVTSNAVSYSPSIAVEEKLPGRAVYCHAFVDHPDNAKEARYILGIIRKTQTEQSDASIAVLFRARDHVSHILPLLKEAGIRFRAVELEPLHNHAVIQDLLALTRALLHLGDRTAWLAVLRAPWAGLSLVDLEAIATITDEDSKNFPAVMTQCQRALQLQPSQHQNGSEARGQTDLFMLEEVAQGDKILRVLSADGRARLQRVLPVLKRAVDEKDRKTFRQWLQGAWTALGGSAVVEDETALKNASVFFDLLERWEYASLLPSFAVIENEVDKLYAEPDTLADEKLQIMSIHKSKGLEFDVVIVPSLQRRPAVDNAAVLMWQQRLNVKGENELLIAPLTNKSSFASEGKGKHPTYQHMRHEQSKKNLLENCRLLYVACTRARRQLYLSAQVKQDSKDNIHLKHPTRTSLLSTIWEPLQTRMIRIEADERPAHEPTTVFKPRALYRLRDSWTYPVLPEGILLDDFVPSYDFENPSESLQQPWLGVESRRVGILVHRYLQQIAEEGLQHWNVKRIEQSARRIALQLQTAGIPLPQIQNAQQRVQAQLLAVLHDKQVEFIFAGASSFAKNEYAVTMKTKSGSVHLVMDRVIQDKEGTVWVIDYKTSKPKPTLSDHEFIAHEVARYQDKMFLYQRAIGDISNRPVKLALYFTEIPKLIAIESPVASL